MKQRSIHILLLLGFILTFTNANITFAQPPFPVMAPDTFTNPILIVIPDKPLDWGTLEYGISVKVSFYYVINDSGKATNIVDNKKLIDAHIYTTGKMHVRGDATAVDPKKQFAVSLDSVPNNTGNFLGMEHGGNHWVFNDCGMVDVTLMRNVLTFQMQQGMGQYAPAWKWFEVFFCSNTSSITNMSEILSNYYRGVYLNFDKIRFQDSRVQGDYNSKNLSGDTVLIQLNQSDTSKYFTLSWNVAPASNAEVYEPDLSDIPDTDTAYKNVNNWYSNWAGNSDSVYTGFVVGNDTNTGLLGSLLKKLRNTTDYGSYATYFLINELSKDQDGYHKSTFMVRRGGMCYAGPLWDKNKSFGNLFNDTNTHSFYNIPNGWLYQNNNPLNQDANQSPQWWSAMLLDSVFCDTVWSQWNRYKDSYLDINNMFGFIDDQVAYLIDTSTTVKGILPTALLRNNKVWQNGSNITLADYNIQVAQLKMYLSNRINWLETNLPILLRKSGLIIPNKK